jgi:hypothetical protein
MLISSLGAGKIIEIIDGKCRIYKYKKLVEYRLEKEKQL